MMRRFNPRRPALQKGSFLQRLEGKIIRIMILSFVLLAVFQTTTITDPVDFYLRFSSDIDAPAFKYNYYIDEESSRQANTDTETILLNFETDPEYSPVKIWQHQELVGILSRDINSFQIKPGTVSLDATEISYPVTVEIVLDQNRYRLDLHGDIKSFNLSLQPPAAS